MFYDHWYSPWNVFQSAYAYTVVDYTIKDNETNRQLIEKYGGSIDTNWYTEEGYGLPWFRRSIDSLKDAYEFMKAEKQNLEV